MYCVMISTILVTNIFLYHKSIQLKQDRISVVTLTGYCLFVADLSLKNLINVPQTTVKVA
jgi:hypothetical protein